MPPATRRRGRARPGSLPPGGRQSRRPRSRRGTSRGRSPARGRTRERPGAPVPAPARVPQGHALARTGVRPTAPAALRSTSLPALVSGSADGSGLAERPRRDSGPPQVIRLPRDRERGPCPVRRRSIAPRRASIPGMRGRGRQARMPGTATATSEPGSVSGSAWSASSAMVARLRGAVPAQPACGGASAPGGGRDQALGGPRGTDARAPSAGAARRLPHRAR